MTFKATHLAVFLASAIVCATLSTLALAAVPPDVAPLPHPGSTSATITPGAIKPLIRDCAKLVRRPPEREGIPRWQTSGMPDGGFALNLAHGTRTQKLSELDEIRYRQDILTCERGNTNAMLDYLSRTGLQG